MSSEPVMYVIFGAATTAVNTAVYSFAHRYLQNVPSNILAWIIAVGFAYFTNSRWVFPGSARGLRSAVSFFGSRILTGIIDLTLMYLLADVLLLNGDVAKIGVNILVIVLNYIFSKLWIFRK